MDRDDLASLDHLSEPQAADERIDAPLDCRGGAEQADHVADERVDVGKGSSDADVGPDPGHGGPPSGADEPSGGPAAPPAGSSSPSLDEVTVLACQQGKRAAKRWSRGPDGSPFCEGYDAGTFFHVQAYRVQGIRGLHEFLRCIAKDPRLFVIRGEPTDEVRASIEAHQELRRKERAAACRERVDWSDRDRLERLERKTFRRLLKPKADSPATFRRVPRQCACFDVDDEPLPAGLDVAANPEGV